MDISNVLVAGDHTLFRAGLGALLRHRFVEDIHVIEVACFAEAVAALASRRDISLVLWSLEMPEDAAGRNLSSVVAAAGDIPVIALSSRDDTLAVRGAFASGARGYIRRRHGLEHLESCIRKVLAGEMCEPCTSDSGVGAARETAAHSDSASLPRGALMALTPREQRVLEGLLHGLSNKAIARAEGISDATVKLHMRAIFDKLGVSNRTQAAMRAVQIMGGSHALNISWPGSTRT